MWRRHCGSMFGALHSAPQRRAHRYWSLNRLARCLTLGFPSRVTAAACLFTTTRLSHFRLRAPAMLRRPPLFLPAFERNHSQLQLPSGEPGGRNRQRYSWVPGEIYTRVLNRALQYIMRPRAHWCCRDRQIVWRSTFSHSATHTLLLLVTHDHDF